jgi:hypothetical protein
LVGLEAENFGAKSGAISNMLIGYPNAFNKVIE